MNLTVRDLQPHHIGQPIYLAGGTPLDHDRQSLTGLLHQISDSQRDGHDVRQVSVMVDANGPVVHTSEFTSERPLGWRPTLDNTARVGGATLCPSCRWPIVRRHYTEPPEYRWGPWRHTPGHPADCTDDHLRQIPA